MYFQRLLGYAHLAVHRIFYCIVNYHFLLVAPLKYSTVYPTMILHFQLAVYQSSLWFMTLLNSMQHIYIWVVYWVCPVFIHNLHNNFVKITASNLLTILGMLVKHIFVLRTV